MKEKRHRAKKTDKYSRSFVTRQLSVEEMKLSLLFLVILLNIYLIAAFPAGTNEKSAAAAAKGNDGKTNKPATATKK